MFFASRTFASMKRICFRKMCVSCRRDVILIHSVHLSWSWASPRWLPTTTFCMLFSLYFLHIYFLTFSTKTPKTHAFLMISASPGPIKYFRFLHIALLLHFAHDSLLPSRATPASCIFFCVFLVFSENVRAVQARACFSTSSSRRSGL